MRKQFIILLLNTVIIFACVGIFANVVPLMPNATSSFGVALVKFGSADYVINSTQSYQSKFSSNNNSKTDDTTNTQIEKATEQATEAMNAIGSKDSDDDCDIAAVPDDIAELMKKARKTVTKDKSLGKTSEEAYQGGGKIISYGNLQIQSKIPESFYSPDIKALLNQDVNLTINDKSKPTILIYHSHTTEAYSLLDLGFYIKSDSRSNDKSKNMVRVGDDLALYLKKAGFNVIHDTEIHDVDYNSSYDSSRETIEKYLEKYPSIDITIDVHRDDITYSNKTKVKPTVLVNGKKAARMMIISGCEYGKVKQFPDWESNLRFNLQIQNQVNSMYKDLMRPILFSQRKYNMFETPYSFLLEIGTDANTLDEACYSARLFGKAFGKLLNDKYVNNK